MTLFEGKFQVFNGDSNGSRVKTTVNSDSSHGIKNLNGVLYGSAGSSSYCRCVVGSYRVGRVVVEKLLLMLQ